MTSMPASRRARAITFAPRSWPSNPGLATRTRIGVCMASGLDSLRSTWLGLHTSGWHISKPRGFLVRAENPPQGIANLSQSRVGANGIHQVGHGVLGSLGGTLQRIQGFYYAVVVAPCAQGRQFLLLVPG